MLTPYSAPIEVPDPAASWTVVDGAGSGSSTLTNAGGLTFSRISQGSTLVLSTAVPTSTAYDSSKTYVLAVQTSSMSPSGAGAYACVIDSNGAIHTIGGFGGIYDDGLWTSRTARSAISAGAGWNAAYPFVYFQFVNTGGGVYTWSWSYDQINWTTPATAQSTFTLTGGATIASIGFAIFPYAATASGVFDGFSP
jgi:hypothetical protein